MTLTRADLEPDRFRNLILQANLDLYPLTETELQTSLQQTLQQNPSSEVWLFAYGSLIWNPILQVADRRTGIVHGFHRRFCLWTPLGRGTPDNPGLVLGLDRGGSCRGVVYRIAPDDLHSELMLVWRREMVVDSYIPRWVKVRSGKDEIDAITFTINRSHPSYAGNIVSETTVHHIATAHGRLGSCADYLNHTIDGLAQAGIHDQQLLSLQRQVQAKQRLLQQSLSGDR